MAITPPKQFCGEAHWSGQPCKACDRIKDRKRPPPPTNWEKPVAPAGPCTSCVAYQRTIADLRAELSKVKAQLDVVKGSVALTLTAPTAVGELTTQLEAARARLAEFEARAAKDHAAVIERVKRSRERKKAAKASAVAGATDGAKP
jgi:hypothetical protein